MDNDGDSIDNNTFYHISSLNVRLNSSYVTFYAKKKTFWNALHTNPLQKSPSSPLLWEKTLIAMSEVDRISVYDALGGGAGVLLYHFASDRKFILRFYCMLKSILKTI